MCSRRADIAGIAPPMLAYRRTSETANALLIGVWETDDMYIKYCVGNWNNSVAQSKPLRAIAHIALAPQGERATGEGKGIPGGPGNIIGSTPIMFCDFNVGSTPSRSSLKINGEVNN